MSYYSRLHHIIISHNITSCKMHMTAKSPAGTSVWQTSRKMWYNLLLYCFVVFVFLVCIVVSLLFGLDVILLSPCDAWMQPRTQGLAFSEPSAAGNQRQDVFGICSLAWRTLSAKAGCCHDRKPQEQPCVWLSRGMLEFAYLCYRGNCSFYWPWLWVAHSAVTVTRGTTSKKTQHIATTCFIHVNDPRQNMQR